MISVPHHEHDCKHGKKTSKKNANRISKEQQGDRQNYKIKLLSNKKNLMQIFYLATANKEILLPAQNTCGRCKIYLPVVLPTSASHHMNIPDHLVLQLVVQKLCVQDR